jgi:hypothetical protein
MSTLALQDGRNIISAEQLTKEIRDSIKQARDDRKPFEATWQSNLAFAAGKFWLKWDINRRTLAFPTELFGRELYSTDIITEYRTTALGEFGSDDDRPELLLRRNDAPSEDFAEQLNRALGWGWDYEWRGDEVLEEMRRLVIDLGTAAIRVRFDPTKGPKRPDPIPYLNGEPVLKAEDQFALFANGTNPEVEMRQMNEGRIAWDVLSPFNLIVPSGVPHEREFPWECVVRPVLLSQVKAEYGELAADLKEDTDIASVLGLDVQAEAGDSMMGVQPSGGKQARLRGHVWLFTYYERPTPKFEQGRKMVFASNKMLPVSIDQPLPCQRPDGTYGSGISYFHWWRVTGRFWSRGLVEAMKDPQRSINKRRTQINEIIDRGLPVIFVEQNSRAKERKGLPVEILELGPAERAPVFSNGISPGEWMYHDIQESRVDVEHATGIRGPRLGENPVNVTTYAQLALLNENDQVKRSMILREQKVGIASLVESTVYEMRKYWGSDRQVALAGEESEVDAAVFDATTIPTFFMVKVAKGSTKPRSQAAELKKIEEIWNAALTSGATMSAPNDWVSWLKDSLEQGKALDLPEGGVDEHAEMAEHENSLLIAGEEQLVQYWHPSAVHIPIHRQVQIQATLLNDLELWKRAESHIQEHVLTDMRTAQQMARMAPPELMPPEEPGGPENAPQAQA